MARVGHRRERADLAGDVDDPGRAGLEQQRQERVHHGDQAEDVRLEDLAQRTAGGPARAAAGALDRARDAGFVDQYVEVPVLGGHDPGGLGDGVVVGHVDAQRADVEALVAEGAGGLLAERLVACPDQDLHPAYAEQARRLVPDALVGARHQCDRRHAAHRARAGPGEAGPARCWYQRYHPAPCHRGASWSDGADGAGGLPAVPAGAAAAERRRAARRHPAPHPGGCAGRRWPSSPACRSTTTASRRARLLDALQLPADAPLRRERGWCIALSGILSAAALAVVAAGGAPASHGTPEWGSLAGLGAAVAAVALGVRYVARRPASMLAIARGTITIVPGGLGIIDSALVLGLVAGGIATSTAIAAVVLHRILSLGLIVGMGWVSWLVIRREAGGQRFSR